MLQCRWCRSFLYISHASSFAFSSCVLYWMFAWGTNQVQGSSYQYPKQSFAKETRALPHDNFPWADSNNERATQVCSPPLWASRKRDRFPAATNFLYYIVCTFAPGFWKGGAFFLSLPEKWVLRQLLTDCCLRCTNQSKNGNGKKGPHCRHVKGILIIIVRVQWGL